MTNQNWNNANQWIKRSVSVKLIVIAVVAFFLILPTGLIMETIGERQARSREAVKKVGEVWGGKQVLNGPVLSIPFYRINEIKGDTLDTREYLYILPERLDVSGSLDPKVLTRGIYDIPVYEAELEINGFFDIEQYVRNAENLQLQWDEAQLLYEISDLRGVKNAVDLSWQGQSLDAVPGGRTANSLSLITVALPEIRPFSGTSLDFGFKLNLQGSENLSFVPVGKTTEATITSSWSSPSFVGNFLPDSRTVDKDGFRADWKILQINRSIPQYWTAGQFNPEFRASAFGLDLFNPLDDYQKTYRSIKYGLLSVTLTFLIFFLVEILQDTRIHPIQYALVGFALCLFYALLLSLSEHMDFNIAYFISSMLVIAMITLYSLSVFPKRKNSLILFAALCLIYSFIFVTLQLMEYALLMGTIGLTASLAATMYLTRTVDWYKFGTNQEEH